MHSRKGQIPNLSIRSSSKTPSLFLYGQREHFLKAACTDTSSVNVMCTGQAGPLAIHTCWSLLCRNFDFIYLLLPCVFVCEGVSDSDDCDRVPPAAVALVQQRSTGVNVAAFQSKYLR